jgi:L-asparaginase
VDSKPRVLVLYTGGTIGMKKTESGYEPAPGFLQQQIARIERFRADDVPDFEVHEFDPLLDSSNMAPPDWLKIAGAVQREHARYDAFLVLHGTDTMAYTAAALAFMLEGRHKPVLLTGSQIPLFETRNDAQENLLTSLMLLGRYHARLAEVLLYFDSRLLRGTRATKVDSDAFFAFDSPKFPPVGRAGIDLEIDWDHVRPAPADDGPPRVVALGDATVASFRIFPGIRAEHLANILAPPVEGVVLECFGSGNAPARDAGFMRALREACARGVVIVAVTQSLRGTADLSLYATGRALLEAGVVSGFDMTPEAALAKLFYLFAQGHEPARVKELVQSDLRGELTLPTSAPRALQNLRGRLAVFD